MVPRKIVNGSASIALALVFVGAASPSMSAATTQILPMFNAASSDTKIVRGANLSVYDSGRITYVSDISHLGFFEKMNYASGKWPLSATFFDGSLKDKNRLCPYIDLSNKDYTIEQIKAGKMKFMVNTSVTQEEYDAVKQAGCAITLTPQKSEIAFKK